MPDEPPATHLRPPWPDEIPRLADAFPALPFKASLRLRVLAVPATETTPERLVGVAALAAPPPTGGPAGLRFEVRARFARTLAAASLLEDSLAAARIASFATLATLPVHPADPRAALLRRAGFVPGEPGAVWRCQLASVRATETAAEATPTRFRRPDDDARPGATS